MADVRLTEMPGDNETMQDFCPVAVSIGVYVELPKLARVKDLDEIREFIVQQLSTAGEAVSFDLCVEECVGSFGCDCADSFTPPDISYHSNKDCAEPYLCQEENGDDCPDLPE